MIGGLIPEGTERELLERLARSDPKIREMLTEMISADPPEYLCRMAEALHTFLCPSHGKDTDYCHYYEEERISGYWRNGQTHRAWVRYAMKLLNHFEELECKYSPAKMQQAMKLFEEMNGGEKIVFMLFLNNQLEEARELMDTLRPPVVFPELSPASTTALGAGIVAVTPLDDLLAE